MTNKENLRALLAEAVPLNTPCPSCLRSIEEERRGYGRAECADTALRLRIDAALAEPVSDDFRRGAKAMREEAATRVDGEGINVGSYFGGIIRALPIPEDEP